MCSSRRAAAAQSAASALLSTVASTVSDAVPQTHRDLLSAPYATLATVGPTGRPQLSTVAYIAREIYHQLPRTQLTT